MGAGQVNDYQEAMMGMPPIKAPWCPFCGRPWTERHHIVPRSAGGLKGPTVTVCGWGSSAGCHGLFETHRLHLRPAGEWWEWLRTDEPTKYEKALEMDGWKAVPGPF